jgi:hypothetical protein
MAPKRKPRVGSKAYWEAEHKKSSPQLENKAFRYRSPSFRKPEYGKVEYFQKGEYSEEYIPVRGAMEKREDVTYVPIAKRFDRDTGEFKAPPVRETPKAEVEVEVETPEQTNSSSKYDREPDSSIQVSELWTGVGQTAPADLEAWVTNSNHAQREGDLWKRKKDNATVIYNVKERTFTIDLDGGDSSNAGWGDKP